MEKPDFEQIASFRSDISDHSMFLGFKSGCEHVWNTHVVPLHEKLKLKDEQYDNMISERNELYHKVERLKIELKELDDDAIVTLQKENDLRGRQLDHYRDQTQKVRTFVFNRNDIGKANQNIFEAVNDHISKLESENKSLREEIERLKIERKYIIIK